VNVPALEIRCLEKRFGGVTATNNVSLEIAKDSIHALIGPNGAGKTTLVAQLSGQFAPDAGEILHHGIDVTRMSLPERCRNGIARSFQITSLFDDYTAVENVLLAVLSRDGRSHQFWYDAMGDSVSVRKAEEVLNLVGLTNQRDVVTSVLAHGEQRQLDVGLALATGADVILLDEPLAGMGSAEAAAMIDLLRRLKGGPTIVLIEHDMDAVFALADRVSVLVYGRVIATGTPQEMRQNAEVKSAYLGEAKL
jgi:branched-chain amino acid transport system ATP-binding protein